jgi:hypothetical protein
MVENIKLYAMRSFYTQRAGLIELEDDVLSIVQQIREAYGDRVTVEVDPDTLQYLFIEHCEDTTDRLIFQTSELDARALERLHRSDSQGRSYQDPYDALEHEQDELMSSQDERHQYRINAEGERLAHALKKDGIMPRLPMQVNVPRSLDA